MAQLYPVAGSKLYIGGPVTGRGEVTAADFEGQDWVEVGGWASAGTIGDTQDVGEQSLINENRVRKFKTTRNAGTMENSFVPMANDPGQIRFKEAIESCQPYAFRIDWGGDCAPESVITATIGEPGVINWNGSGFLPGQPITFESDDALPGGLTADTVYYVVADGLTDSSFSVAAEPDGTPVEITSEGTGTIIATAPPAGMTDLFYGLALPGARSGGDASAAHLRTWSIAVDSNVVEV